MDIFGGLRKLLGIQEEQSAQRPVQPMIQSEQPNELEASEQSMQQPNYGGVSGSVNPVWQQQQGMGISNPLGISRRNGGPTPEPLPAFAEILKRLR